MLKGLKMLKEERLIWEEKIPNKQNKQA